MKRYLVQSGPLKITIVATSAYDAALEAVRWWDDAQSPADGEASHRASLDAVIEVRIRRASGGGLRSAARPARLFPTFNLLARALGESPAKAWERVLREKVGQLN
jgi:hypothetical protein